MEDIICPECERPNLCEAEKCWYCQTSLQDIKASGFENRSTNQNEGALDYASLENPIQIEEPEQDIPEWLKLVRELKEADQPLEKDDPDWQQQDLFNSEDPVQKIRKTRKKKSPPKNMGTPKSKSKEKKNDNLTEFAQVKPETKRTNQEKEELYKDLPEGFTKL